MYHNLKPQRGSITPGSLPSPSEAFKHVIPVFLTQRSINSSTLRNQKHLEFIDLKNEDAQLPYLDETVHWCKMFKLSQFSKKNHIVRVCFVCVLLLFIIVAKLQLTRTTLNYYFIYHTNMFVFPFSLFHTSFTYSTSQFLIPLPVKCI